MFSNFRDPNGVLRFGNEKAPRQTVSGLTKGAISYHNSKRIGSLFLPVLQASQAGVSIPLGELFLFTRPAAYRLARGRQVRLPVPLLSADRRPALETYVKRRSLLAIGPHQVAPSRHPPGHP